MGASGPVRPYDYIDAATHGGAVDSHADIPLPNKSLRGDEPGFGSMLFEGGVDVVGVFDPQLRNFNDHVTRDTMIHDGKGVQVFSDVTKGFPVVPNLSFDAYTWLVNWPPDSTKTALVAWIWQIAFTYREVEANSDILEQHWDFQGTLDAIQRGKMVAQLGTEGAFPFTIEERDLAAVKQFICENRSLFPRSFPMPTELELSSTEGLMTYARRCGQEYIGLTHLIGGCGLGGGGPWPEKDQHIGDQGRDIIAKMDPLGIMLDVAHASPSSQDDIIAMKRDGLIKMPTIASHSLFKVKGDEPDWRVTKASLLPYLDYVGIIGARAHLRGFNFCDVLDWLLMWPFRLFGLDWHFPGWTDPMDYIRDIVAQIKFVRDAPGGGIDKVGLGLDGDGFVGLPFKNYAEMHDAIRLALRQDGSFSEQDIDKIFGGNWLHVLQRRDEILKQQEACASATAKISLPPPAGRLSLG